MTSSPHTRPRVHLPKKFDPFSKKDVKEVIARLIDAPPQNFKAAAQWFGLFHELSCAVSEAQTLCELNVSLDNSHKNAQKKLEEFEQNILVQLLSCREKMMEIYLNSPFKQAMHAFDNFRIAQDLTARKKIAGPALSQLHLEENQLIRDYKKLANQSSTPFAGRPTPLPHVIGKMHDSHSLTRKDAFFSYWGFVSENADKFNDIFDRLLLNRRAQATQAGCKNYTQLAFIELGRFDYNENDCAQFRNSILKTVVPILSELSLLQAQSLTQKTIKPYDSHMWPALLPCASPAQGSAENWLQAVEKILCQIHPSFHALFLEMKQKNLMDIFPRAHKSPGAFSVTLHDREMPYLFGNFSINARDSFTFFHEFGHCLHSSAMTNIQNILLRQPGFEYCELASIGLELLASKHFHLLWPHGPDAEAAMRAHLFQMLQFWPFMAMIDEWQHAVYSCESFLNAKEREELWRDLSQKYRPHIDWDECPEYEKLGWLSRPHVFTSPFYFIDYGIAQVGALQLWQHSKENYAQAVEKYMAGLSLGAQVSLPDLYHATGVKFDFSEELLKDLCSAILSELLPVSCHSGI